MTDGGISLESLSSSIDVDRRLPFASFISAHICLTTVELTSRYRGSPSRNIVRSGHTSGPYSIGPHVLSICRCRSSGPSAAHVRIPRKKRVAFWVRAYLQMYPSTTGYPAEREREREIVANDENRRHGLRGNRGRTYCTFHLHVFASRSISVVASAEHLPQYLRARLRRDVVNLIGVHADAAYHSAVSA